MSRRLAFVAFAVGLFLPAARAEDTFFDSKGIKIHYQVEGAGEPVLLIHGFTANIQMQWALPGIIKALAKDYQVIALDNRGHGRSGKPHDADKYGTEMVEDAVRLLDHLKVPKAHIVGYSMGAFITLKFLTTHPDRCLTATLGGAGRSKRDDLRFLDELGDSLEQGKGFGPLIRKLAPPGKPQPTEQDIKGIDQFLSAVNDLKALAAVVRGMKRLAVAEDVLKTNRVPVLALVGELDPLKVGVDDLQGLLANLQTVVIEKADHMDAFTKPAFINSLKDFLARHRQKG